MQLPVGATPLDLVRESNFGHIRDSRLQAP